MIESKCRQYYLSKNFSAVVELNVSTVKEQPNSEVVVVVFQNYGTEQ